jgi:hypothetical protein
MEKGGRLRADYQDVQTWLTTTAEADLFEKSTSITPIKSFDYI